MSPAKGSPVMAEKGQKRRQKGSPANITAVERELLALEFRKQGLTYRRIGLNLGITEDGAWRAVMRGLRHIREEIAETAPEVLDLELQRLDDMFVGHYKKAKEGDARSTDICLRIMERRARYLGLDAAIRQELTGADGGPVQVDLSTLTDEELALLHKIIKSNGPAETPSSDRGVEYR